MQVIPTLVQPTSQACLIESPFPNKIKYDWISSVRFATVLLSYISCIISAVKLIELCVAHRTHHDCEDVHFIQCFH